MWCGKQLYLLTSYPVLVGLWAESRLQANLYYELNNIKVPPEKQLPWKPWHNWWMAPHIILISVKSCTCWTSCVQLSLVSLSVSQMGKIYVKTLVTILRFDRLVRKVLQTHQCIQIRGHGPPPPLSVGNFSVRTLAKVFDYN